MRILATFPGRNGDLLWALPTIRAIAEHFNCPVDLLIAGEFESIVPLLEEQPYLNAVKADPAWGMSQGWQPRPEPSGWDHVYHLGYRRWPELPLPFEVTMNLREQWWGDPAEAPKADLTRPWITLSRWPVPLPLSIVCGFSDCWFELKYGLLRLLERQKGGYGGFLSFCPAPGSRWVSEAGIPAIDWKGACRMIHTASLFFGDCSALHVLAVAMGVPVVLVEPMEARWLPIFYPFGMDGPQVTVVKGLDGRPTFDARHCYETLEKVLHGR